HRRSGRRSLLLDDAGTPIAEPWCRLREVRPMPATAQADALRNLTARTPATARPAPLPARTAPRGPEPTFPIWTRAHFVADPEIHRVLTQCALLGTLRDEVCNGERIPYPAQLVLRHTLGHLERGPFAVNYLLGRCRPVPEQLMGARLRGSPMSCSKVRERLGQPADCPRCTCDFAFAPDS